jgi:predicted MFS family arabinose efflux permease
VLQRIRDRNIVLLYGATVLLGVAYGVSIALTALHLDAQNFTKRDIGSLASWFALGIVALSLPMGSLIRRFSAKTTLVSAITGYAVCVTLFPLLTSYEAIAAARFCDGACSVGIWVSSETILLSRADKQNKAFVTSLYAIAMSIGYVVGPLAARMIVAIAPTRTAFLASGILSLAASALVAARLERDIHGRSIGASAQARTGVTGLQILLKIKTSCFATFAYGYFQASVVLFLPLFLIESKGVARDKTILVPAFFAAGMLLFSNIAGRVSDRLGHLVVMRFLAIIGMTMVAAFVFLDSYALMSLAVFVAGGTLAALSPVSLALQGVVTDPADYSRSNSIYNVFYAAGMLLGPPISSALYARFGGAGMLFHLAALWGAFVLFTVVFYRDDPAARRMATEERGFVVSE